MNKPIIINQPRMAGRTTKALMEFFVLGKQGKAVIITTPEGDFLSPKAVDNLIEQCSKDCDKEIEFRLDMQRKEFLDELNKTHCECPTRMFSSKGDCACVKVFHKVRNKYEIS